MTDPVRPPGAEGAARRNLVRGGWVFFGMLLVQNVLGMGLNLYVALPSSFEYTQLFTTAPLLTAHIVLAFLLLIGAAFSVLRARTAGVPGVFGLSVLVLVFVLVAVQEGFGFVFTGNLAFSYGMDVAFVLAVGFQSAILYRTGQPGGRSPERSPVHGGLSPPV